MKGKFSAMKLQQSLASAGLCFLESGAKEQRMSRVHVEKSWNGKE
jgi:hypothetical protein